MVPLLLQPLGVLIHRLGGYGSATEGLVKQQSKVMGVPVSVWTSMQAKLLVKGVKGSTG